MIGLYIGEICSNGRIFSNKGTLPGPLYVKSLCALPFQSPWAYSDQPKEDERKRKREGTTYGRRRGSNRFICKISASVILSGFEKCVFIFIPTSVTSAKKISCIYLSNMESGIIFLTIPKLKQMEADLLNPHWLVFYKTESEKHFILQSNLKAKRKVVWYPKLVCNQNSPKHPSVTLFRNHTLTG